jgi:hypothetical protein
MHHPVTQSSSSTSFAAPGGATGSSVDVRLFRESQAMIGQELITPPISPGHSEDDTANTMALDKQEPEPTNYPPEQVQHPTFTVNASTQFHSNASLA